MRRDGDRTGSEDDLGDLAGLPGLADLPELAARMTRAGLRVIVHSGPLLADRPRSLDVSAYRIIQEALTNALKHGGAATATVTIHNGHSELGLEVADDGRGAPAGYARGRGLLGMAERAGLFGGAVEHGSDPAGGFRVRARLPVPPVSPVGSAVELA